MKQEDIERLYKNTVKRVFSIPDGKEIKVDIIAIPFAHAVLEQNRATLRPFAHLADMWGPQWDDDLPIVAKGEAYITLGDLRRAYREYFHVD